MQRLTHVIEMDGMNVMSIKTFAPDMVSEAYNLFKKIVRKHEDITDEDMLIAENDRAYSTGTYCVQIVTGTWGV